jgi:hypothetical protein
VFLTHVPHQTGAHSWLHDADAAPQGQAHGDALDRVFT